MIFILLDFVISDFWHPCRLFEKKVFIHNRVFFA